MPERTYQVRVAGLLGIDDAQARLHDLEVTSHQVRTVLVGRFAGQDALLQFLRELRAHGLEVLDVRRPLTWETTEERPMGGPTVRAQVTSGPAGYELTVAGDVEDRARAALAPYATALKELHTDLRTKAPDGVGFLDLVLLLETRGLRIASIAVVDDAPVVPRQRMPLRRLAPTAGGR